MFNTEYYTPFCLNKIIHSCIYSPAGTSTKQMLRYSFTMKDEDGKVRWYNAKHREVVCMLPGKYYRLRIATGAVNKSVCEDSHTEDL